MGERRVGGRRRGREAVAVVSSAASAVVVEVLVAAVVERLLELSVEEVALVSPSEIIFVGVLQVACSHEFARAEEQPAF